MEKCDLEAEEATPRAVVDELCPRRNEPLEFGADVVHLERHVMHARPALGKEPADRRVGPEGGEQLHPAATHLHRGGLDALVGDRLPMLELRAEEAAVGLDGFIQIVYRHSEMVNLPHGHAAMLAAPWAHRRPA